jgi:hypothetical protein
VYHKVRIAAVAVDKVEEEMKIFSSVGQENLENLKNLLLARKEISTNLSSIRTEKLDLFRKEESYEKKRQKMKFFFERSQYSKDRRKKIGKLCLEESRLQSELEILDDKIDSGDSFEKIQKVRSEVVESMRESDTVCEQVQLIVEKFRELD